MASAPFPPVIAWDYQFAPNAQKSRNYLHAAGIPYKICEQPFVLPRPILNDLGITYRRVPVLSIGKDVFCDNSSFIDAAQHLAENLHHQPQHDSAAPINGANPGGLRRSPHDRAFEAWGYRSFWVALPTVPADLLTPALKKDRANLFEVFTRDDFANLRQNGLSELKAMMAVVENEFLLGGSGPWIGGAQSAGLADIHAVWIIKWCIQTLGIDKEPGFSEKDFPGVHKWITSLPALADAETKDQHLTGEEAIKQILASDYALKDVGIDSTDPLQLKAGDSVGIEATDAKPGTHPQVGKLVGLSTKYVVVQIENGVRVHFPRVGYLVNKA